MTTPVTPGFLRGLRLALVLSAALWLLICWALS